MLEEFIILFIINYMGIILSKTLNLPIPGTIIALFLFFILLYKKILKVEKVENAVAALILNMPILFLPPAVKVMDNFYFLDGKFFKVLILIILTTFITMGVTGKIVQLMIELTESNKKGRKEEDERIDR